MEYSSAYFPISKGRPPPNHRTHNTGQNNLCCYSRIVTFYLTVFLLCCVSRINCECDLTSCWNLYQLAQEHLGVRDEYPLYNRHQREQHTPPPVEVGARCLALRTFYLCLGSMRDSCRSELSFHGAYEGIERQIERLHCNLTGAVFDPDDVAANEGPRYNTVCTYKQTDDPLPYYHCSLFGDPHLRTFVGNYETCRLKDVWPLLDNRYVTVQVTNTPVGVMSQTSTAISEVTVVIKAHSKCATDHFTTYQALANELPDMFSNGHRHVGKEQAVVLQVVVPRQHVEIYLRYIDTAIVIRLVGYFYSVAIKIPQEVVNSTIWLNNGEEIGNDPLPSPVQLCAHGCPNNQRIVYQEIIAHAQISSNSASSSTSSSSSSYKTVMAKEEALRQCRNVGLVDYYLDSCVFDLMSTGDTNFTLTSLHAYNDSLRLIPELARSYKNRTTLDLDLSGVYRHSSSSGSSGSSYHTNSAAASSSAAATIYSPVTVYSILYKSHLNYLHRTMYVLLYLLLMLLLGVIQCSS